MTCLRFKPPHKGLNIKPCRNWNIESVSCEFSERWKGDDCQLVELRMLQCLSLRTRLSQMSPLDEVSSWGTWHRCPRDADLKGRMSMHLIPGSLERGRSSYSSHGETLSLVKITLLFLVTSTKTGLSTYIYNPTTQSHWLHNQFLS